MKKLYLLLISFVLSFNLLAQKSALYFDGVDDYILVPGTSKLNGLSKITLETWLYSGNFNTSPCSDCAPIIWNQGKAYRFGSGNTRVVNFSLQGVSSTITISSTQTLSLNTWHHIAGTYDGTKMRIYIDGVATDSLTSSIAITYSSSTADVWIADPNTGWGGILEETRIWDYALSRKEILESMIKKYKSSTPGLVLQYGYEDGTPYADNTSITSINDKTSYGNNGKAGNFKMKDTVSNFVDGRIYCDTVINSKLTITQCVKYTLPSKKKTVTTSGTYKDTLVSKFGCDSVITISVTIHNPTAGSKNISACDSFRNPISGILYKKSSKFTSTIKNSVGCDSVITFFLTIYGKDSTIFNYDGCVTVTLKNGKKVTSSGRYVDYLKGAKGCDSLVVHIVKVRKASFAKQTMKVCKFLLCPTNLNKVFYEPGIYFDTIQNKVGCDSVIEYEVLTANTYSNLTWKTCKPLKSPSQKYTYSVSGTYLDTLKDVNHNGCDSFITISLTVDEPIKKDLKITACGSYTVPSGTKVINMTQNITDVIRSKNSCDSLVYTIEVTINNPNTGITRTGNKLQAATSNGSALFQWLDCNAGFGAIAGENNKQFSPKANGSYALEVKENGCVDTSNCFAFALAGLNHDLWQQITVSSNPGNGNFSIQSKNTIHNVKVSLMDRRGAIVHEWEMESLKEQALQAEVSEGLYYLKIESSEGFKILPMIFK